MWNAELPRFQGNSEKDLFSPLVAASVKSVAVILGVIGCV